MRAMLRDVGVMLGEIFHTSFPLHEYISLSDNIYTYVVFSAGRNESLRKKFLLVQCFVFSDMQCNLRCTFSIAIFAAIFGATFAAIFVAICAELFVAIWAAIVAAICVASFVTMFAAISAAIFAAICAARLAAILLQSLDQLGNDWVGNTPTEIRMVAAPFASHPKGYTQYLFP